MNEPTGTEFLCKIDPEAVPERRDQNLFVDPNLVAEEALSAFARLRLSAGEVQVPICLSPTTLARRICTLARQRGIACRVITRGHRLFILVDPTERR